MAKLVKMTSGAGLQPNSNSFTVRSDDDIIIPPNSSVALLNGFISSGIVADYRIENTQTLGQVTGDKLGELYLNADTTQDRARTVVLSAGEYGITPMMSEMTDAFNRSLIYRSLPVLTAVGATSFVTPPEADFGLEVNCKLNTNNQISIQYNSAAQKTTADLDYTNKSNGVQVAANGDITYTTPGGYAVVGLDAPNADDALKIVYTTTNPNPDPLNPAFSPLDSVSLSSADGKNVFTGAQIDSIAISSVNTNFAIPLDVTVADKVNDYVYSTKDDYLVLPAPIFNVGDLITMDDGTGVLGTPAADTIYGKVDVPVDLFTFNPNAPITECHPLNGFNFVNDIAVKSVVEVQPNIQHTITVDAPFADAATFHLVDDAIFYIKDNIDQIIGVCQITAVAQDPNDATVTIITTDTKAITGAITPADFITIGTIEMYLTDINQSLEGAPEAGDTVAYYNGDALIYSFVIDSITAASTNDDYLVVAEAGSLRCLSADGATLLDGIDAMELIIETYTGTQNNPLVRNIDKVLTRDPVDLTADFKDTDAVVFGDDDATYTFALDGDSDLVSINGANHTRFTLDIDLFDIDGFKLARDLMTTHLLTGHTMYKTSNGKRLRIHLINLNPNNTKLDLMTRIFPGTDVTNTYEINLRYANTPIGFTLRNYSVLVKGSLRPAQGSYVVEDSRLNHACGRVCFLISNADLCEFGVIPETANFAGQSVSDNDLKIAIERDPASNNLVYKLYRGQTAVDTKINLRAKDNDRVIVEWGVTTATNGYEFSAGVDGNTNPAILTNANIEAVGQASPINEVDSRKILVSVLRQNAVSASNYLYLGCPNADPDVTNVNQVALCQAVPWTPRTSPYISPQYWNNDKDLHVYVSPFQATVRILELSPTPMITFDGTAYKEFDGEHTLLHTTLHAISDPAQQDEPHKLKSFANVFNFKFTNIDLQRRFGYKTATNILNGASGSWSAEKSYLSAYLPENLTILLDTLSNVQSYDLEQNQGRRRSIIGVVVNSQDRIGEISIEPSNLYKIKLNNKEPVNLRRFVVSLEDFYGNQIKLQSARAVINLLFEEP